MGKVTIKVKSAGPAAAHQVQEQVQVSGSGATVRWPNFMLRTLGPRKRRSSPYQKRPRRPGYRVVSGPVESCP